MTSNIITILLFICLFFGLAKQIFGKNPKHFDDEERIKKQDVASTSSTVEKNHEERVQKNKQISKKIIAPKFLNVLKWKGGKPKGSYEQLIDINQKKKGIAEQNDADETLNSPKNHHEFLKVFKWKGKSKASHEQHIDKNQKKQGIVEQNDNGTLNSPKKEHEFSSAPEGPGQSDYYENDKAKVPDDCMECPICNEFVNYDQLCFCDNLIGIGSKEGGKVSKETHAFCRECLKGYIEAALEMKPFARGWLGLKCMAEKCENPIPWQEMEKDASSDEHELETIKKLENDCAELCVSAAGLYLQRCPKCNCAVEMDGSNDELKFHCPECKYDMCRKCNEKWADEHNHLTCEQFAKQQNREGYLRDKQKTEDEIKRRKYAKCPGCKTNIEKTEGCKFMNCRCGTCFWYCCGERTEPNAGHFSHNICKELPWAGVFLLNEKLGSTNEIVKHVLLMRTGTTFVPTLAVFAAAANVRNCDNAVEVLRRGK